MKTVYRKNIGRKETNLIARQIMAQVHHNLYQADSEIDHAVASGQPLPVFYPYMDSYCQYVDDDYYSEIIIYTTAQSVVVEGYTTSGTLQAVNVSNDGTITVTHDGARSSCLGRISWYIPVNLQAHLDSRQDWLLREYKTSKKSWFPVSCFLPHDADDPRPRFLSEAI